MARSDRLIAILKPESHTTVVGRTVSSPSAPSSSMSSLNEILEQHETSLKPLFGPTEEHVRLQQQDSLASTIPHHPDPVTLRNRRSAHPLAKVPDLSTFYYAEGPKDRLEALKKSLENNDLVKTVYIRPAAVLTVEQDMEAAAPIVDEHPGRTPNFLDRQLYLNVAPTGVDAKYAWLFPGGRGARISVVDIEGGWDFSHENLCLNPGRLIEGTNSTDRHDCNHGTAALGVVGAANDNIGITGIASDATLNACGEYVAMAIFAATRTLRPGDVIFIEVGFWGPNWNGTSNQGQVPVEWDEAVFYAIQSAVAKGIVVVEGGANGHEDLDQDIYNSTSTFPNPFNTNSPSSGAIIVGGGTPPPGTHVPPNTPIPNNQKDWVDRSIRDWSNWGSRVDVQGWHREVTATGYGDLQGGKDPSRYYTDDWGGTSSATAIIAGLVASLQGILQARGVRPLTSKEARRLLRSVGSHQQDAPGLAASGRRIGKRPSMRKLIPLSAGFKSRSADYDGDGKAEILAVTPSGLALFNVKGDHFEAIAVHNNKDMLGDWQLKTYADIIGPVGDFDGDGVAETFVQSQWGIGILKLKGNKFTSLAMARDGAYIGEWFLDTCRTRDCFGPVGDFDGDGADEILVSNGMSMAILKLRGNAWTTLMFAANGTQFGNWTLRTDETDFSQVGRFDGGKKACIFASSPLGIALLGWDGNTLNVLGQLPNGAQLGSTNAYLDTNFTRFGPVGNFSGDERQEIFFINRTWGIGVIKFTREGHFIFPMLCAKGESKCGWPLDAEKESFPTAADFDGDGRDELLVHSSWGIAFFQPDPAVNQGRPLKLIAGDHNWCHPAEWLLQTRDENDWPGSAAKFTTKDRASILVESRWGIGILEINEQEVQCPVKQKNETKIGKWTLQSLETDFGHGF
ncbi:subtilisin-like protein [Lentithecium fluviatile CBS 122367]|uniref:Subtilisin-like protein n=1 Tax=Lentithecium fluviatile CBS 122367 TaxID=1168545 RepID=A0A6G1J6W4_9PLEO|nr:subtilisin-like protein [Lentithecium fluviatile CBS 122367]